MNKSSLTYCDILIIIFMTKWDYFKIIEIIFPVAIAEEILEHMIV
jgi:hypothetical protein